MNRVLDVIADRDTGEDQLLLALSQLGSVTEPPGFWTKIANSSDYTKRHRCNSVFQFFTRHVRPGMKLSELARILDGAQWLADEDITVVEDVSGYIPVRVTHDNTVFVMRILAALPPASEFWGVFLSVFGWVDRENFIRLLRGGEIDEQTRETAILEIGFVPPILTRFCPNSPP